MSRSADRFVAEMGAALKGAGMPPLASRVFAALLVHDDGRMTAAELGRQLAVSPAGVSGAVRYLTQVRMVRRERAPGSRREVYVVDEDAWHRAVMSTETTYAPMVRALERGAAGLGPDGASARRRLDLTREFLLFVEAEMVGLAKRWERHKRRLRDRTT